MRGGSVTAQGRQGMPRGCLRRSLWGILHRLQEPWGTLLLRPAPELSLSDVVSSCLTSALVASGARQPCRCPLLLNQAVSVCWLKQLLSPGFDHRRTVHWLDLSIYCSQSSSPTRSIYDNGFGRFGSIKRACRLPTTETTLNTPLRQRCLSSGSS